MFLGNISEPKIHKNVEQENAVNDVLNDENEVTAFELKSKRKRRQEDREEQSAKRNEKRFTS